MQVWGQSKCWTILQGKTWLQKKWKKWGWGAGPVRWLRGQGAGSRKLTALGPVLEPPGEEGPDFQESCQVPIPHTHTKWKLKNPLTIYFCNDKRNQDFVKLYLSVINSDSLDENGHDILIGRQPWCHTALIPVLRSLWVQGQPWLQQCLCIKEERKGRREGRKDGGRKGEKERGREGEKRKEPSLSSGKPGEPLQTMCHCPAFLMLLSVTISE